jgi:hypothetical protein
MKTSETQTALIPALLAAQQGFPVIAKTKEGQAGNRKFKYAPLEEVKHLCDPVLWKHGLMVTQGADGHELVTRLDHSSGEWRETRMPMMEVHASDQAYGISFSYRRRYSYQGILGIVTEEDVDGNGQPKKKNGLPDSVRHTPTDGPVDVDEDRQRVIQLAASVAVEKFKVGDKDAAFDALEPVIQEGDEELFLYQQLKPHSALRAYIKFRKDKARQQAKKPEAEATY